MDKRDRLEFDGIVIDDCKGCFKVQLDSGGNIVQCTLSGKIRQRSIKILVGDKVKVEVSEYDMSKGRIVFRNEASRIQK